MAFPNPASAILNMISPPTQIGGTVPTAMNNSALFNPPDGDPFAALTAILNNLSGQAPVQMPKQSPLDMILEGIAQAAAVAASPDPGGTLGKQIEGRRADRRFIQEQEVNRQNFINQVKVQAGIQQATNLQAEQAKVREENRRFRTTVAEGGIAEIRDVRKERRALRNAIDLKEADLKFAERERQNVLDFENRNEAVINILRRNKAYIDMLPETTKEKVKLQSLWGAIVPDVDPGALGAIAEKVAGVSRIGLTPTEKLILNRINAEIGRRDKEFFEAGIEKTRAEAEYARGGKQGSIESLLKRTMITNTTDEIIKGIGDVYVKMPDGSWKAEKNLTMMESMLSKNLKRSTPEEAAAETARRIKAAQEAMQQTEAERIQEEEQKEFSKSPASPLVRPTPKTKKEILGNIPEKLLNVLKKGKEKNRTDEQLRIMLKDNGATDEQIDKLVPKPVSHATPTPKTAFERAMEMLGKGFRVNQ